jgi:hypothetical protein
MSVTISTVYTFDMPKFVYVQVHGTEKPVKILADNVTQEGTGLEEKLVIKRSNQKLGEFKSSAVQGWWIADDPETTQS